MNLTDSKIVFVTTTVFEKHRLLTQKKVADIILGAFDHIQQKSVASIVGYVIMPSHIHALLGFHDIENLSTCIQGFKSVTSREVKLLSLPELSANDYRLWKPRFDDLIISSKKQFKIKMEYIHNNPVKAGLVAKAEDWIYSSAGDWLTADSGMIALDKEFDWLKS